MSRAPTALKVFAVLFVLLAISNFTKPLQLSADQGFVLFGNRLSGTSNMLAGPLFGAMLVFYAAGIWNMKRYALPLGIAYALYVITNLTLWVMWAPPEAESSAAFAISYTAIAVGISSGTAYLLYRHRDELT